MLFMNSVEVDSIQFVSADRELWLRQISDVYHKHIQNPNNVKSVIEFAQSIKVNEIKPFHLVTLACLIHYLDSAGKLVAISNSNLDVFNYIYNDLKLYEYWSGGRNHVETSSTGTNKIFNLWRIVEDEKDLYAKQVEEYFRKQYFRNKDLSAISLSLVEAYYNVFDHAKANGNAFSVLQYDEENAVLYVAISDFGIGIAQSVRDYDNEIKNDKEAIIKAIEDNFTVRSTKRNRGMGLSNILSSAKEARIFSHYGLVRKKGNEISGYDCVFPYPGTLIYYEIDLSSLDDEEILDEFII